MISREAALAQRGGCERSRLWRIVAPRCLQLVATEEPIALGRAPFRGQGCAPLGRVAKGVEDFQSHRHTVDRPKALLAAEATRGR